MEPTTSTTPNNSIPDPASTIAAAIQQMKLSEMGPVLGALKDHVIGYRADHDGYVPQDQLPLVLGIAGLYTCLEYVPRIINEDGTLQGYLLRQRNSSEQGWVGEFHIPGVTLLNLPKPKIMSEDEKNKADMIKSAQKRLGKEFSFLRPDEVDKYLKPAGIEVHDEPERNCACITIVHTLDLPVSLMNSLVLSKEWRVFTPDQISNPSIVDHHRNTLRWINRPDRKSFEMVDLRY